MKKLKASDLRVLAYGEEVHRLIGGDLRRLRFVGQMPSCTNYLIFEDGQYLTYLYLRDAAHADSEVSHHEWYGGIYSTKFAGRLLVQYHEAEIAGIRKVYEIPEDQTPDITDKDISRVVAYIRQTVEVHPSDIGGREGLACIDLLKALKPGLAITTAMDMIFAGLSQTGVSDHVRALIEEDYYDPRGGDNEGEVESIINILATVTGPGVQPRTKPVTLEDVRELQEFILRHAGILPLTGALVQILNRIPAALTPEIESSGTDLYPWKTGMVCILLRPVMSDSLAIITELTKTEVVFETVRGDRTSGRLLASSRTHFRPATPEEQKTLNIK